MHASFGEALAVGLGGKSEGGIYLQRAIPDPFLIIGIVGIIVVAVVAAGRR